jgi:hypothetical protein
VGDCTQVCPKHVDPAGAIQQAKVTATSDWFWSLLVPWGKRRAKTHQPNGDAEPASHDSTVEELITTRSR